MTRRQARLACDTVRTRALAIAAALTFSQPALAASGLVLPFAVPAPQRVSGEVSCPLPPSPVMTLATDQPYRTGDTSFSQLDTAKAALREQQLAPIKAFSYRVAKMANAYTTSHGADTTAGVCTLKWLDAWASQNAMRAMQGHDAQWLRLLDLTTWASAFAQVKGLDLGGQDPRQRIGAWLRSMTQDEIDHFSALTKSNTVASNNHRYWAGFAAIAVAVDNNDRAMFDWGISAAQIGLKQVSATGTLPLEIARSSRARQYSLYATEALNLVAEYGAVNGVDLYRSEGGALQRLTAFSLRSLYKPDVIAGLAGAQQVPYVDSRGELYTQGLAWVEYYNRRFPGRVPEIATILSHRPLVNNEIGGNLTMLVGTK